MLTAMHFFLGIEEQIDLDEVPLVPSLCRRMLTPAIGGGALIVVVC